MSLLSSPNAVQNRARSAWPTYALVLLLFVGLALTTPGFLRPVNLANILNQQVALSLVTLGQVAVILTGGLDLSVGSVVSMTTAILSLDLPAPVVTVLAILAALGVGAANAAGIVFARVHPVLMTLGSMTVVQGIALLLRPTPGGSAPGYIVALGQTVIGGIHLPVWIMLGIVIVAVIVPTRTRFGIHVIAAGGSAESAELGGVPVRRVVAACYVISAMMACLGGFVLTSRIVSGDPLVGTAFAFDSIAAAALGGVLLAGGVGTIGGALAGVAVLALLSNGLNFWNISAYYQMLIKGFLLVAAVSTQRRNIPGL